MPFETTPAHEAIFDAVKAKKENLSVSAVAGSGKTSTMVEACKLVKRSETALFLAFNKSVQLELAHRLPPHVPARTLNSLGHATWGAEMRRTRAQARLDIDPEKSWKLWMQMGEEGLTFQDERRHIAGTVMQLSKLAKSFGIVPGDDPRTGLMADDDETWAFFFDRFDLDVPAELPGFDTEEDVKARIVELTRILLAKSLEMPTKLDFDDQLWMPFVYDVRPAKRYTRLFVDEAQDLSPLQHALVSKAIDGLGKLCIVGDPFQSLYAFRGSDSNSMGMLEAAFNCRQLPLHVSYRCPRDVVAVAQKVVPHIQAHATAPQGLVDPQVHQSRKVLELPLDRAGALQPGDFVVSRTNAPAAALAFHLLRQRRPAEVLGRDLGGGLKSLIKKLTTAEDGSLVRGSIDELLGELGQWELRETQRALKRNATMKAELVKDKAATIRALSEGTANLRALDSLIGTLFKDPGYSNPNAVRLSSIHKAKGLEAKRVWILNKHLLPHPKATQDWEKEQERNAEYVAITRAREELRFVEHLIG